MRVRSRRSVPRDLLRAQSGVALIEFSLVLPLLLMLYLAGTQLADAIGCNRKVTITARTIADMIAQNSSETASDIDDVLASASTVMSPYKIAQTAPRVAEVQTTDNAGTVKVIWSRAGLGAVARPVGSTFSLPPAQNAYWIPNITFIVADVSYNYVPLANFNYVKPITLTQSVYMMARKSDTIPCADCS